MTDIERERQFDPDLDEQSLPAGEGRVGWFRACADEVEDGGHGRTEPDREQERENVPLADLEVQIQLEKERKGVSR